MTIVTDHGHLMPDPKTIPAGEFKAKCLKLMDEVEYQRRDGKNRLRMARRLVAIEA